MKEKALIVQNPAFAYASGNRVLKISGFKIGVFARLQPDNTTTNMVYFVPVDSKGKESAWQFEIPQSDIPKLLEILKEYDTKI